MMSIKKIDKRKCCGCSVCKNICPKKAIHISADTHGFLCPILDESLCVECGLCISVCPVVDVDASKKHHVAVYGVENRNKEIKKESTSGGLFSLIADYILNQDGAVYGAIYNSGKVEHIRATADCSAMRGSKYCQSNIEGIIDSLISDLRSDKFVLFTGTPCQCAGIKKLLEAKRIKTDNLLLVDIICHGVVSPHMLEEYINYAEKKAGKKIVTHRFRTKYEGWGTYLESNDFEDGTTDYKSYESQLYKRIFLSHYALRESCFNCEFTTYERVSDITMGDFWGLNKTHPDKWNDEGISCAIVSTEKGQTVFGEIKNSCDYFEAVIEDTIQPQLHTPSNKPEGYEEFWSYYLNHGFKKIVVKYYHGGYLRRTVSSLINSINRK